MDLSVIWRLQDLMSAPVQRVVRTAQVAQRSLAAASAGMSAGFRRTAGSVNDLRARIETLRSYRDGLRIGVDASAITRASSQLQQLQSQLEKVEKINARKDGSGGVNKGLVAGVIAKYLPYLSATAAVAGVGTVAKLGMDREMSLSRFEQFIPDKKQAHQTFGDLNKWGNDTIYQNSDVLKVGARVAEQFGANKVMSQMKMYGDLAGGDGFAMQGIARTMGQIKGVGHLQGDELNELANHGILGLQTQIAKMKGVSIATFNKMKEAAQISFDDVQKAMEAMTGKGGKYFGYLDKVSATTFGRMQKLIGTVQEKFTLLATANLPTLNKMIDWANKFIDNFAPIGQAINKLVSAFNPLWDAIYIVVKAFGLIPKSADGVQETIGVISTIISKLGSIVQFVSSVIYNLVTAVQSLPFGDKIIQAMLLYGAFSQLNVMARALSVSMAILTAIKGLGDIGAWLSLLRQIPFSAISGGIKGIQLVWVELNAAFALTPIGAIIISIVALVAAITYAWQNSEKFREVVVRSWVVIQKVFEAIKPYLLGVWEIIKNIASGLWELIKFIGNIFRGIWVAIVWVKDKALTVWNSFSEGTKNIFKGIGEIIVTTLRVALGVATLGLSEFVIWALKKLKPIAETATKVYNGTEATDKVKELERQRFLDKDRSDTASIRNARRAARYARGAGANSTSGGGATGAGAGAGDGKDKSTVSDTVEGTRSKNIVINIDKLLGTTNIYAEKQNVGRSIQDEVTDALIRILSSGEKLAFE